MTTLQDVQKSIERLAPGDRRLLWRWLAADAASYVEDAAGDRVEEAAPAYGAAAERLRVSAEEYLRLEAASSIRHEYVAGEIFAMSGASLRHNRITGNLFNAISTHVHRGGACTAFFSDVRLHLEIGDDEFFYYPDLMVVCGQQDMQDRQTRHPRLLIEVLSPSTQRTDRWEKARNYLQIPTLEEYVLVLQDAPYLTFHRREQAWSPQVATGRDAVARFQSIDLCVPLRQIYEGSGIVD